MIFQQICIFILIGLQNERTYRTYCDQQYSKIINSHSVRWRVFSEFLKLALKLFPSLNSYLLSKDSEIRDRKILVSLLKRLINLFSNPLLEVHCQHMRLTQTSLMIERTVRYLPVHLLAFPNERFPLCVEMVSAGKRCFETCWRSELQ